MPHTPAEERPRVPEGGKTYEELSASAWTYRQPLSNPGGSPLFSLQPNVICFFSESPKGQTEGF